MDAGPTTTLETWIKQADGVQRRREGLMAALGVALPAAGVAGALMRALENGVRASELGLFAAFYVATMLGITMGYHRLFAHRSFEAAGWLRTLLAVLGSMAVQGPVIRWVADHRRHHARSDRPGDVHSPRRDGWWHAHVGWFFGAERTRVRRTARDLLEDPRIRAVDRLYFLWMALSLALPALVGAAIWGGADGALSGLLWGGLTRVFVAHHATWSVNSLCHLVGRRPFRTSDDSRNNGLVALLTLGEGWHNNHHAFPRSARHGLSRLELDPTWWAIRVAVALGWARAARTPGAAGLRARRTSDRRLVPSAIRFARWVGVLGMIAVANPVSLAGLGLLNRVCGRPVASLFVG